MIDSYVEKKFVVRSALGLHARPAGRLASVASQFDAVIEVSTHKEWVNARDVLSLLTLGAGPGTTLRIRACGADAESAILAVGELISEIESETGDSMGSSV